MVVHQKCKSCRETFADGAYERTYSNFARYGFRNAEDFKKHSSRNRRCPCKHIVAGGGGGGAVSPQNHILVTWPEYKHPCNITTVEDYQSRRNRIIHTYAPYQRKINRGEVSPLWFSTTDDATDGIIRLVKDRNQQWISLVAQPGSGKTMVIHRVIHRCISQIGHDSAIHPDSITVTTGMSDTSWYMQTLDNLTLRNGTSKDYIWTSLNDVRDNHCLVHRANLHKRISYLLDHPELIHNHLFIMDESHFADGIDMTIDDQLRRLGLTGERMRVYNIKVILVSATPDVTLSIMDGSDSHTQVILQPGEGYKGFKYYTDAGMIEDYNTTLPDHHGLEQLIRHKWSSPRYHYIRARIGIEKGEYRENIKRVCSDNNWRIIPIDSDEGGGNAIADNPQETQMLIACGKNPIRTYEEPSLHTVLLLKDKFRASKRLELTNYIGLVAEKPAVQQNTTVTCNGLIPRFFSYPGERSFPADEKPLFLCNLRCVEEYISFTNIPAGEPWMYEGKDYTAMRIKSTAEETHEKKPTVFSNIEGIDPEIKNNDRRARLVISIPISEEDSSAISQCPSQTRREVAKDTVRRLRPNQHSEYEDYRWQCWTVENDSQKNHYGLANLTAQSHSSGHHRAEERDIDIVRIYYVTCEDEPRLVISPMERNRRHVVVLNFFNKLHLNISHFLHVIWKLSLITVNGNSSTLYKNPILP